MPTTDWNAEPPSNADWLKAKTAKPAPRMGACLVCARAKCGCWSDDPFGVNRERQDTDAAQPMLRLVPPGGE